MKAPVRTSLVVLFFIPFTLFAQIEFTEHTVSDNVDGPRCVFASDIDSDGDIDLVAAVFTANDVVWFENDGDGEFTDHVVDEDYPGALTASAADIDGDDDIDLIATAYSDSTVGWYENDGNENFVLRYLTTIIPNPHALYTTDIDGDDDVDIMVGSNQGNAVILWTNDGTGTFEQHLVGTSSGVLSVFAADVDSDDDIDILSASMGTNQINWWENDGELNFTIDTVATNFMQARSVFAADVDSDGNMDVLGAATNGDDITWWENDGEQVFTQHIINGTFDGAYNVHAVDLDDDGDIDVLGTAYIAADVTWWENDGEEDFTEYLINGNVTGASWVITADLDSDEDLDVIATATNIDEIIWWEHLQPDASLSGTVTDSETGDSVEGAVISFGGFTDTTDVDGYYGTEEFYSSDYTVTIVTEGYFDYEEEDVEVEEGENEINFEIVILSADLTGIVTDAVTEEPLAGAAVTVTDPETGEPYREVETDEDGEYLAEALHDGVRYLVCVVLEGYALSDTEEVTIRWNGDNEQDFELTPIFVLTIEEIQTGDYEDRWIHTVGIVTQPTNSTNIEATDIYIQDETGYGIRVWDADPWEGDDLNRGDEIDITGLVEEWIDVTRIIDWEIVLLGTGNPMPDPLVATTGEMAQNDEMEGSWVQIGGQINTDPPGEGDVSLVLNDGSGQINAIFFEITGIDLSAFSADDWMVLRGVLSLTRNGVRIVPNAQEDVERVDFNVPTDLSAETEELVNPVAFEVVLTWLHEDETDDFIQFNIYRDDEEVGNSTETTWTDTLYDPNPGESGTYTWIYTVTAVYDEGETEYSNEAEVIWDITHVFEHPYSGIPTEWSIAAAYPNPFNPTLTVIIGLPELSELRVNVFDILGREIAVLADGRFSPGYKHFTFDATGLSSGIYFIHASVPEKMNEVRKVVLIR